MRRHDIQLLAAVRQGDVSARCEVGRRYLSGADGFPKHIQTGIGYLTHPSIQNLPQAAVIIADALPLEELLLLQRETALEQAAIAGCATAQTKLGAWLLTRDGREIDAVSWLEAAARAGNRCAEEALDAHKRQGDGDNLLEVLRVLSRHGAANGSAVAMHAVREARADCDLRRMTRCLHAATELAPTLTSELAELVVDAVRLAEDTAQQLIDVQVECIQASLELRSRQGDHAAAYTLGRALSGIACGSLAPARLASSSNLRKGTALLMRAADGGQDDAWLHLYQLHAEHRSSVANPQMARLFLEKAAARGKPEAQRKLGALMLRESDSLDESEKAIHWLYQAASQHDAHAQQLLATLVLPLAGSDEDAMSAIVELRRSDPWLAVRLQLSRDFGLTKLEALTVDPADGLRPWGLVVGRNPFIDQSRLSAPRAIPAISPDALADLQRAAAFFEQTRQDASAIEGDLRRRSLRQRRAFAQHHIDETLFFASATSTALDSLRRGPKWAFKARQALHMALVA
jgi:TPR repeat protein